MRSKVLYQRISAPFPRAIDVFVLHLKQINGDASLGRNSQQMQEKKEPAMMDADLTGGPVDAHLLLQVSELADDFDCHRQEPALDALMAVLCVRIQRRVHCKSLHLICCRAHHRT
jgi:hypothetical protein